LTVTRLAEEGKSWVVGLLLGKLYPDKATGKNGKVVAYKF